MKCSRFLRLVFLTAALTNLAIAAEQAAPSGSTLFIYRCQGCHGAGGRATQLSGLSKLPPDYIYKAITTGSMKTNADGMSEPERKALVDYIAASRKIESSHIPACAATARAGDGIWNGWSRDASNTRFQPTPDLTAADVPRLKLRWALVSPSVPTAANPITILQGRLYTGSWDGTIYSLDALSGCSHWTYQAETAVRTGITITDGLAVFGDLHGTAYAVDVDTGELPLEAARGRTSLGTYYRFSSRIRQTRVCSRGIVGRRSGWQSEISMLLISRQRGRPGFGDWQATLKDSISHQQREAWPRQARSSLAHPALLSGRRPPSTRSAASFTSARETITPLLILPAPTPSLLST